MARLDVVYVEMLDHDHDHWCRRCLLASGLRVFLVARQGDTLDLHEHVICTLCHGLDVEVGEGRHC